MIGFKLGFIVLFTIVLFGKDVGSIPLREKMISALLNSQDPFVNAEVDFVDSSYPYQNLNTELPWAIFELYKFTFGKTASLYLEIGTMLGNSLFNAHSVAPPDTVFLVIDTFLGGWQNWEIDVPHEFNILGLTDGSPTIFKRFLANMKEKGIHKSIVPLQITSVCGLRLIQSQFKKGRIPLLPQIIYLDTSHEEKETLFEIEIAWCTLPREGGILYGDDWLWLSVRGDVIKFADRLYEKQKDVSLLRSALERDDSKDFHTGHIEEVYSTVKGERMTREHPRVLQYDNQWIMIKLPDDHILMCP